MNISAVQTRKRKKDTNREVDRERSKSAKPSKSAKGKKSSARGKTEAQFSEDEEIFTMSIQTEQDKATFPEIDATDQQHCEGVSNRNENASLARSSSANRANKVPVDTDDSEELNYEDIPPSQEFRDNNNEKEDGQISDEEISFPQAKASRILAKSIDEVDESVKQEIIGETVAKTMRQLMESGRLRMESELCQQNGESMADRRYVAAMPVRSRNVSQSVSPRRTARESCSNHQSHTSGRSHLSISDLTIYEKAIEEVDQASDKRHSSSSEEATDTSDELLILNPESNWAIQQSQLNQIQPQGVTDNQLFNDVDTFIGEVRNEMARKSILERPQHRVQYNPEPMPSTSGYKPHKKVETRRDVEPTPEDIVSQLIRDAEARKQHPTEVLGKLGDILFNMSNETNKPSMPADFIHSVFVDETYMSVASHIDSLTKAKIIEGKYIDFGKLLP